MPFDLSQMLAYRARASAGCDDRLVTQLREHGGGTLSNSLCVLIALMLDRQPRCRPRASQALAVAREKRVFPAVFYDQLRPLMDKFVRQPSPTNADDLMARLEHECRTCLFTPAAGVDIDAMPIVASVCTALVRALRAVDARLTAVDLLHALCTRLTDQIVLDRMLPYMVGRFIYALILQVYMLCDACDRVRAQALVRLVQILEHVTHIEREDCRLFIDYLLPERLVCCASALCQHTFRLLCPTISRRSCARRSRRSLAGWRVWCSACSTCRSCSTRDPIPRRCPAATRPPTRRWPRRR